MKISVLGCGRWGSFIAWYLNRNGHTVTSFGIAEDPYVLEFFKTRTNSYVTFPESINLTTNLEEAIKDAEVVIISISSQHLRDFMKKVTVVRESANKKFVLCMKGIENTTGKRLSEVMIESGIDKNNVAVWVGPGHIQEFTRGVPNLMIIDSYNKELSKFLVENFKSDLIRYYQGDDIIGTEIGAAAKNVMGIAAGMLDGGGFTSLKGALIARGAREVSRLIKAAGGNELSAYGLCHIGDYEATLFSEHSHNRKYGESFVKGERFEKLAEGVPTSLAMLKLADSLGVEMPITKAVYSIVYEDKEPMQTLLSLFARTNLNEF
ncbi:MAG: NAD(P)-binding domain-containing protein [Clostridia bacterium]|nr:NAD(P)-binding domain-containing protein [Clostridia bacterium]